MNEFIFILYVFTLILFNSWALILGKSALISLIALEWVLANLFVTKQITLIGLNATASDALAVGATLGLNLIQEEYGKPATRKAIIISFTCLLFYTITSLLHLSYIKSPSDLSQEHFLFILSPMPRLIFASLITSLVVQYSEYRIYGFFSSLLKKRFFVLRNYASVSVTQAIDTVLFTFLGLYGVLEHIGDILFISYTIKLVTLFLTAPFLALARKLAHSFLKLTKPNN